MVKWPRRSCYCEELEQLVESGDGVGLLLTGYDQSHHIAVDDQFSLLPGSRCLRIESAAVDLVVDTGLQDALNGLHIALVGALHQSIVSSLVLFLGAAEIGDTLD